MAIKTDNNSRRRFACFEIAVQRWKSTVHNRGFLPTVFVFLTILVFIVILLPYFFSYIELRKGVLLSDPLLDRIHPIDISPILFTALWAMILLVLFRSFQHPLIFLQLLVSFTLLTILRITAIFLIPLEPPRHLITLTDPLSNYFYGQQPFITRDLFFSGHTATVVLIYFCLRKKNDRRLAFLAFLLISILVLVQHVHYTIDVLAAPVFAWLSFLLARQIIKKTVFDRSR